MFAIAGTTTRLDFSDGVAFVPPRNDYLAACNLTLGTIAFYRKRPESPIAFEQHPSHELWQSLDQPDGLAFSPCGEWLAVANHGNHSVSIFRRRDRIYSKGRFRYGPAPVEVITDPALRYPHSTAFSEANHLLVTNAGANYFSVFLPAPGASGSEWSKLPAARHLVGSESGFRQINSANKMEGGPKGIAVWGRTVALCCPQDGVKMYSIDG